MDHRAQRGRSADARVLLDQGAQPALQRPVARRQELPVPRRHQRRDLAAGDGHARHEEEGHPLFRPVRARLRDPRHAGPAAAEFPDSHVQPEQVQRARTARPAVPAVPHREVLGSVRRRDRGDGVPPTGHRAVPVPRRRHRRDRQRGSRPRCALRRPSSSSSGPPGSATASMRCARRSRSSRWSPTRTRTST